MSLGPSTVLTCDQARTRTITIIAAVKNGEDPAAGALTGHGHLGCGQGGKSLPGLREAMQL